MTNPTNQGGELNNAKFCSECNQEIDLQGDGHKYWCHNVRKPTMATEKQLLDEIDQIEANVLAMKKKCEEAHLRADASDADYLDIRSQLSAAKETIDKVRRWEYNNFPMGCRDVFPLNGKSRAALRDILKKGDCDDN